MPTHMRALCALLLVLIVSYQPALAQAAPVTGTVTSRDGRAIPRASVTINSQWYNATAVTDAKGVFRFQNVPAGTYDVTVAAAGFTTISNRTIDVGAGAAFGLVLEPSTNASLTVIGQVRSTAGETVSTSSAPVTNINAQAAAAAAVESAAAMVWPQLGTTPVLPLGGGDNAVQTFAVRGPDPTETIVDIDGHQVNNGGTGDFDLTLLDPAALRDVQIIYGISPSALVGPNTLGGAINVLTLDPTVEPHALLRGYGGSYNSFGQTVQATGTTGKLGYAVSLHRATSTGSVNQDVVNTDGDNVSVGSALFGETAISKLRYQLGSGYGYLQVSFRDQISNRDISSLLTNYTPPGFVDSDDLKMRPNDNEDDESGFQTFQNSWLQDHQSGYGFDAQIPLSGPGPDGAPSTMLRFSHLTTISSQSVSGPAAATSSYLYNQRDTQGDDWLQLDHRFAKSELSFRYGVMAETLNTQYVPGIAVDEAIPSPIVPASIASPQDKKSAALYQIGLAQTQRTAALRYTYDPTSHIHFALAGYQSDFSTFGSSFDPRAGVTWTPSGNTAVRASVGTTFQAVQLTELLQLPTLPPPVGGVISIGNPNLRPDYATLYDIGGEQIFGKDGQQTHVSLDLYRTNLRSPAVDIAVTPIPGCGKKNHPACPISMPINAGNGVYSGINVTLDHQFGARTRLRAGWDEDSSYLTVIPPDQQDGTLVSGEQSLGQPMHKAYLGLETDPARGLTVGADLDWEGTYNELNRSPYATLAARVVYTTKEFQFGLYGTNLTNVYANPFTVIGGGVPYGSLPGTPMIPTDAYILQGTKIVFVLTRTI